MYDSTAIMLAEAALPGRSLLEDLPAARKDVVAMLRGFPRREREELERTGLRGELLENVMIQLYYPDVFGFIVTLPDDVAASIGDDAAVIEIVGARLKPHEPRHLARRFGYQRNPIDTIRSDVRSSSRRATLYHVTVEITTPSDNSRKTVDALAKRIAKAIERDAGVTLDLTLWLTKLHGRKQVRSVRVMDYSEGERSARAEDEIEPIIWRAAGIR